MILELLLCVSSLEFLTRPDSDASPSSVPLLAVEEDIKMGNGRSVVLGSSLPESEESELMKGATAAVGRQQSLSSHNLCYRLIFSHICLVSSQVQ